MILVDSSVLVDFLRGTRSPAAGRLRQLERDGTPYAVPAICAQEVIQGAANEDEWTTLVRVFQGQRIAVSEDPWSTHVGAARIYIDCRRGGFTIRSSIDCLIAQLALDRDDVLLHADSDFEHIQQVRPLRTLTD